MVSTRSSKGLRRKSTDSDSETEEDVVEFYITYDDEEDDEETIGSDDSEDSETDDEEDAEEELLKRKRKTVRKLKKKKQYEDNDDEDDDDDEDEMDEKEIRKEISKMFPSSYIKKKVKRDEEESRETKKTSTKKNAFNKLKKNSKYKPKRKMVVKRDDESESESDESYVDDDEDDINEGKVSMIVDLFGGASQFLGGVNQEEEELNDEGEECDSDDEKMFLKETYEQIEVPENIKKEDERNKKKEKNTKNGKKSKKRDLKDDSDDDTDDAFEMSKKFDVEYKELLEMRKTITERLKKRPESEFLKKALRGCRNDIKKLVKKTRGTNTKKYYKMVNSQKDQFTSEVAYFKKKLSHQEQLRIMQDVKAINDHIQVDKPYRLALLQSDIPIKYKANVLQKVNMLKSMEPGDPEYYKIKSWVDDFMQVPFGKYTGLDVNLSHGMDACNKFMADAMEILDKCAYGLRDAKMQILQMVGQWISNPQAMGTAIAIKGPMGTGKTTLVKDGISKILQRYFAFIPLGGCGDSSFLEGHSYTYEGSGHGKIVQVLKESKSMNPVFYFDELDKVSDSSRGEEIIGILTHLTDTSQNNQFHDKYFADVDFDLSKSLFIFSYNDESRVNPILKDRMYCIQTKGYDTKEKLVIARDYLLPKIREQVNFDNDDVIIPDETIEYIITNKNLTKEEDGVRNLKRCLEVIHTKINLFRLVKMDEDNLFSKEIDMKISFPYTVGKEDVDKLVKSEPSQNQSVLASMYI